MLWTILVILFLLYGLGLMTTHTMTGIDALLVIAIVVVLIQVFQRRRHA